MQIQMKPWNVKTLGGLTVGEINVELGLNMTRVRRGERPEIFMFVMFFSAWKKWQPWYQNSTMVIHSLKYSHAHTLNFFLLYIILSIESIH